MPTMKILSIKKKKIIKSQCTYNIINIHIIKSTPVILYIIILFDIYANIISRDIHLERLVTSSILKRLYIIFFTQSFRKRQIYTLSKIVLSNTCMHHACGCMCV